MSNYYEYRDVKVAIAHRLMEMDGWKVYGYKPDQSDAMTDYWDPAYWDGIAEKNGYILCVDVYGASEPKEIREYNYSAFQFDASVTAKIAKLSEMTVERGASEDEEKSAKLAIARLQKKAEESAENSKKYIVTGMVPGHMENPPRCNWHIEKDGKYIAKGNGILKYYRLWNQSWDLKDYMENPADFEAKYVMKMQDRYDLTKAREIAAEHCERLKKEMNLKKSFDSFINKLDTTCGGMLGSGDGYVYEDVKVTQYKKEIKVFETANGEIKDGQCFILKVNFNYGCFKGLVYRIHKTEYNGKPFFHAYKLNGKLTKECTGHASTNNRWMTFDDRFLNWIAKGAISWCELREVKTPYVVEKVVKRKVSNGKPGPVAKGKSEGKPAGLDYTVEKGEHTKTHEPLWLVKIKNKLSKERFAALDGYYSKFTHSFVFKYDPTEKLKE